MKILLASSEATPYVKTGGLADVIGALFKEYRKMGENVHIILPLYKKIKEGTSLLRDTGVVIEVPLDKKVIEGRIFVDESLTYFIECDKFFNRQELYGTAVGDYSDNASRFIFFSRGILEACRRMKLRPDIIHCNDWQTALVPMYLKTIYSSDRFFKNTATVLTIHNLGYQGLFPPSDMPLIGLGWELFTPEGIEFYGKINFIKAGIIFADVLNTVSLTYAKEILTPEYGLGLEGVLRKRARDLYGITNSIDKDEWDPSNDPYIFDRYSTDDISGKINCKRDLIGFFFGSSSKNIKNIETIPVIGMVGRLSSQKGFDLVIQCIDEMMSFGVRLVILGKGDEIFQKKLSKIAKKYRNKISFSGKFEESLAHRIYAGSDFFLMPSKYEPCGLGQLISMRYGCIPIARRTGGLADTIDDFNPMTTSGTGFLFSDYTPYAMIDAVKRALCVFTDPEKMRKMIINCMNIDLSWRKSAENYFKLYKLALKKKNKA